MYSEFMDRNREGWKFTYTGAELLAAAKKRSQYFAQREKELRDKLTKRLQDPANSLRSSKNGQLQAKAIEAASRREQCEVFAHEFNRKADREFSLSIGDVVFFGLAGHDLAKNDEEDGE